MENRTMKPPPIPPFHNYRKPTCYTTIAWRTMLSPNQNLIIGLTMSLAIIPAILLNSAYCYALYSTKQLKRKSKLLVFLQSASDLFFGAISIPGSVILFIAFGNIRSCWLERLVMFIGQTNGHISLYILMVIAMQRYFAVRPRLGSSNNALAKFLLLSRTGLAITIFIVVVWSTFNGLVSVYFFGYLNSTIPNIMVMVLRSFIVLLIYIIYFRLYFSIKSHQRDMMERNRSPSEISQAECCKRSRKYSSFLKTVSLVLIVNAGSYIPLVAADCWTGFYTFRNVYSPKDIRFAYYLLHFTVFLNACLNTAIYLFRDNASRAFLRKRLCNKRRRVEEIGAVKPMPCYIFQ